MRKPQITLTSLLWLSAALPIWIYLAVEFAASRHFWGLSGVTNPLVAAPMVICGLTLSIHELVRHRRNGWVIACSLAGVVAMAVFSTAVWLAKNR